MSADAYSSDLPINDLQEAIPLIPARADVSLYVASTEVRFFDSSPACTMSKEEPTRQTRSRGGIVRDLLVFQVKLWLESFKDVALFPLSLGAAFIDLLFGRKAGRGALYGVMRIGDRFEQWINLYRPVTDEANGDGTGSVEEDASGDLSVPDEELSVTASRSETSASESPRRTQN